ncbi:MAG: AAA family ATPase [Patescibacteria group bacterium]
MYLKSLTLSGFKSFGRTTVFEFPTKVAAIVGPNGSGKSNVAEGIRWVLGEQSMKSLRGKKGEDLIFNGSEKAPRLGRAEVKLIFDNTKKQFPFEFDEVIISRRVVRDGSNEYLLNGSTVRLKDIFELLSKVGLGSSQHHIISQGEVDRILWANPSDRQAMIEDALGLREFYMKARESERKLAETEFNVKQVEAQRREIQPHIKYLKSQADKMKAHESNVEELAQKAQEYAKREKASLESMTKKFVASKNPVLEEIRKKEDEISKLRGEVQREEREFAEVPARKKMNEELDRLEEKRRSLERELGKVEGMVQGARASGAGGSVSHAALTQVIRETIVLVDEIVQKDSYESLKSGLKDIRMKLETIIRSPQNAEAADAPFLQRKDAITKELGAIEKIIAGLKIQKEEDEASRDDLMADLRERERALRDREREVEILKQQIREVEFTELQYQSRVTDFAKFMEDLRLVEEDAKEGSIFENDADRASLLRSVDRLRLKLEEAGGIDPAVLQEYNETLERDAFLARELEDLKKAQESLERLLGELHGTLKERFSHGIEKISQEFNEIFKIVFGGGKAALEYVKPKKIQADEMSEEIEEEKSGIEVVLDIPRKRIRSLEMLSGGERALTSVALLFAMSAVNPPPFLVLDETDAALDEANSQRYGDLLERLAKKAQLIVITHNRETMRHAGVLYGVTQGDDAISRVLSVKLEEASAYAKA